MKPVRQKAKDLIALAMDKHTTEEERLSAALKAVSLIHQHNLLAHPLDKLVNSDDETVHAAVDLFGRFTDPEFLGSVKKVVKRAKESRRSRR
jgi:hypothetical protein